MSLIDRVKAILLNPRTEWPIIEQEPGDIAGIYRNYLIYLAAIPALAAFIGLSIFGFGPVRIGFFSGLVNNILSFLLSLVMFYVLALIVDALAQPFGGTKNQLSAFKLVAYSSTASLVAGALMLIPALAPLALIGSLYSLYLFYLGVPVLMKCPQEKALPYTLIMIVCAILASLLIGAITRPALGPLAAAGSTVTVATPGGEVKIDTARLEEASRKLEAATRQINEATRSGDSAATSKAATEALAALGASASGGGREPMPSDTLKAALPETLNGMKRTSLNVQSGGALGVKSATAEADYQADDRRVQLKIIDMGGLAGLAALANWANVTGEKETDTLTEKTYRSGNRTVKETAYKDGSQSEYSVILENGVVVEVEGRGVDLRTVKSFADALNLSKLESYKGR